MELFLPKGGAFVACCTMTTQLWGDFLIYFLLFFIFPFFPPLLREEQIMRKKKGMGNNLFIDFVWYTKREEKIG